MKNFIFAGIVGCALLTALPAGATPTTFNFTSSSGFTQTGGDNFGNSFVFGSGLTVTVKAYSNDTYNTTNGTTFQTADVGHYSGTNLGLGICNQNSSEGVGCSSPKHQVDNQTGYEFMVFQFSTAVDLNSLVLSTYDGVNTGDAQDFTYKTGTGTLAITPNSTTLSSILGGATTVTCSQYNGSDGCNTGDSNSYGSAQNFSGNNVNWLIVGAAYTGGTGPADYFKISSLSASIHTSTPEPGTFGVLGLALMGLGLFGRKRLKKA